MFVEVTEEQVVRLYEISAELGKYLQQSGVSPAEAVAALVVTAGRLFAREGYSSLNENSAWDYFAAKHTRAFFDLGFCNERIHHRGRPPCD